jgi:hypothetical protein
MPYRRTPIVRVPPPPAGFYDWAHFRLQTDARLGDARPQARPDTPVPAPGGRPDAPAAGRPAARERVPARPADGRIRPNVAMHSGA